MATSIINACVPRDDVLHGRLTDAHFAAQLDQVVRNPRDYPVYGDPDAYFAITYPTRGLRQLLTTTFGRITGASAPGTEHGVLRLATSFGGGKTHALMAVYHLAKGARPARLDEFVDPSLLPSDCQIAAVVADTLDPENGLVTNGIRTHTLWGELAAQIGPEAYGPRAPMSNTCGYPGSNARLSAALALRSGGLRRREGALHHDVVTGHRWSRTSGR